MLGRPASQHRPLSSRRWRRNRRGSASAVASILAERSFGVVLWVSVKLREHSRYPAISLQTFVTARGTIQTAGKFRRLLRAIARMRSWCRGGVAHARYLFIDYFHAEMLQSYNTYFNSSNMPLITCPCCKEEISSAARACPRCGETDPSRKKRNKAIASRLFGALIVIGASSYFYFFQLPQLQTFLSHKVNQTNTR